jgi:CzcA family heavy metal efflux pump
MFNWIVTTSLNNRLMVLALGLLLMIGGIWTSWQTPVDVFPDLNKPMVTVMTEAGGMAPQEVEQLISFPLETALNGMPGVTRIRSISGIGLSIVYAEFEWGSDLYRNRQLVAERIGLARERLPRDVNPIMGPVSSIMGEIMLIALPLRSPEQTPSAAPLAASLTPMQAREYVDFVMRPRLLAIPGVSQVIPIGGEVRTLRVSPDSRKMAQFGVSLSQIEQAVRGFSTNAGGGFVDLNQREYLIRLTARTTQPEDLAGIAIGWRDGRPITLAQVATVGFFAGVKRGDAGYAGDSAIVISVQKQPQADSLRLTSDLEAALAELAQSLPLGFSNPQVLFRQADFIQAAISNVMHALRDGAVMVAIILFAFLLSTRTTLISLTAIPLSLAVTALIFRLLDQSINVMTLGGLAIAIGELVDDAVVDVENILRRLRQARSDGSKTSIIEIVRQSSLEVRSGIIYATAIVILVFMPLFALPGIEGRLFTPLGIAYIVSILASMFVSMTVTPVMSYYLLPGLSVKQHVDSAMVAALKRMNTRLIVWALPYTNQLFLIALVAVAIASTSLAFFPRSFLPAFNEGTFVLSLNMQPGTSLRESNQIGAMVEQILMEVPEVRQVGRRTGRAELDEHAEGVHVSEIDIDITPSERSRTVILADIRSRLVGLPFQFTIGQPISHRLDHLLSGVRAQIAIKVYGDDLESLRSISEQLRSALKGVSGLTDLSVEKQTLIPQIQVRLDYQRLAQVGLPPGEAIRALKSMTDGAHVAQVIDGNRRFDVVLRLPDSERTAVDLAQVFIDTSVGRIEESDGPNQIGRENSRRRMIVFANSEGRNMADVITDIRNVMKTQILPRGYHLSLEGQFQAQEKATEWISLLSVCSLTMIFVVLYSRYRSTTLALIIMSNIPLALVGSVIAMAIANVELSVASMVGFITLAGISTRNGILKISHYINLCRFEGEQFNRSLIIRGSLERLTPVLMTACVAAFALTPLLLASDAPGKEILHPVAVVIFGGLISSTILDTLLTPLLYLRFGGAATRQLVSNDNDEPSKSNHVDPI